MELTRTSYGSDECWPAPMLMWSVSELSGDELCTRADLGGTTPGGNAHVLRI